MKIKNSFFVKKLIYFLKKPADEPQATTTTTKVEKKSVGTNTKWRKSSKQPQPQSMSPLTPDEHLLGGGVVAFRCPPSILADQITTACANTTTTTTTTTDQSPQKAATNSTTLINTNNNTTMHASSWIRENAGAQSAAGVSLKQRQKISLTRERKAARTLGIIMGAFTVCWLPFFILYLLQSFHLFLDTPKLFEFFTWLGYVNSALNPIIYTIFNLDFRKSFERILFKCILCKRR
jgi:hypothetical protein